MKRFAVILLLLGLPAGLSAQNAGSPQTLDPASLSPAARIEFEINRSYYDRYRSMVELAGRIKLDSLKKQISDLGAILGKTTGKARRPPQDPRPGWERRGREFGRAAAETRRNILAVQSFRTADPPTIPIDSTTSADPSLQVLSDNRRSIREDVRHKKEIAALAVQILSRLERDFQSFVLFVQQKGGRGDAGEIAAERIRGLHATLSLLQAYVDELQSLDFRACGP
ncbi:MAG: hypothetical protein AABY65_02300 [Nitrospirota bacterium]